MSTRSPSIIAAQVSAQLLDPAAHLLFDSLHAEAGSFGHFGVAIAIKAPCEKYVACKGLEATNRLVEADDPIARFKDAIGSLSAMRSSANGS